MDTLNSIMTYVLPVLTAVLSFFAAIRKSKNDIEKIRTAAQEEREKLQEQYRHELELLEAKTDKEIELLKAKKEADKTYQKDTITNDIAKEFLSEFMKNPDPKKIKDLLALKDFFEQFQSKSS